MAYADQQGMSTGRIVSIAAVLILHAFLGYALVTGLAYEAVKNVQERLEVLDVQEEKPPEEEPPPPPPDEVFVAPPPAFAAPSPAPTNNTSSSATNDTEEKPEYVTCPAGSQQSQVLKGQQCQQKASPTKTCWDGSVIPDTATCPDKPVEKDLSKPASPKNNKATWVTTNDYPSRSLSREEEGTSRLNMTVGPDGRVTGCSASGATAALDAAACQFATRRARFNPALDKAGNPTTGQFSTSVRWVIPK
jgi:periplasmic protein TonB